MSANPYRLSVQTQVDRWIHSDDINRIITRMSRKQLSQHKNTKHRLLTLYRHPRCTDTRNEVHASLSMLSPTIKSHNHSAIHCRCQSTTQGDLWETTCDLTANSKRTPATNTRYREGPGLTWWYEGSLLLKLHVGQGLLVLEHASIEHSGGTVGFFKCRSLW